MARVSEFFQKISEGKVDANLRIDILKEILGCLELRKDAMGTWEKALFAQSLAYLSINAFSKGQSPSLWLRLSLDCLEKAMIPEKDRNEEYTDGSEVIESIDYGFLVAHGVLIRRQIG